MQNAIKDLIARQVRGFFNDGASGERPVQRRTDGLFGPGSVAWKVHDDVGTMMVGGVAALLMQMLHPAVLGGVWDHSNFRQDMHGRLRRTARFIALTTYGSRAEAEQAIARVRAVHRQVVGTLPDGTPYSADDPDLLAWVHVTEAYCFLEAWKRYAEPAMPNAEQDRYFAEMREVAVRLGVADIPASRAAAVAYMESRRGELETNGRTREVVKLVLDSPGQSRALRPLQKLAGQAAIDLLPRWARRLHHLPASTLARPAVHGGTAGMAGLLRWAFS